MVSDPALMPDSARGIVDAEALTTVAVDALENLMQNAALENGLDARVGNDRGRMFDFDDVPVADPEVELVIGVVRAGRRNGGDWGGTGTALPCEAR